MPTHANQGREQDTHDLLEQFTAIADELNDNLDDYGPHHRDLRKALPKLVDATERWSSNLKSPPDNEAYNVSRRLALEAVATSTIKPRNLSKSRRPGSSRILRLKKPKTLQSTCLARAGVVRLPYQTPPHLSP